MPGFADKTGPGAPQEPDRPLRKFRDESSGPIIRIVEHWLQDAIKNGAVERALKDFNERDVPLETILTFFDYGKLSRRELMQQARRRVELAPEDPVSHRLLALVHGVNDEFPAAIKEMERAVALTPQDQRLREELGHWHRLNGYLYREKAEIARAAEIFQGLMRADPKDALYAFELGLMKGDLQQFAEARDAFAQAVKLDPKHANAMQFYARACDDTGMKEQARDAYFQAGQLFIEKVATVESPVRKYQFANTAKECFRNARGLGFDGQAVSAQIQAVDRILKALPLR